MTTSDERSNEDRHHDAPGFGRVVSLLVGGAIAVGFGWLVLYLVYRYLGSDW